MIKIKHHDSDYKMLKLLDTMPIANTRDIKRKVDNIHSSRIHTILNGLIKFEFIEKIESCDLKKRYPETYEKHSKEKWNYRLRSYYKITTEGKKKLAQLEVWFTNEN